MEEMSTEERNLLSVAFKNAVGLRRIAWRAAQKGLKTQKFAPFKPNMENYVRQLEEECVNLCKDLLSLITKYLYPNAKKAKNTELMVYFLKMQGDYYRYVAEVSTGDRHEKGVERCLKCYNEGIELAEEL
jgi:14-3-3 protein